MDLHGPTTTKSTVTITACQKSSKDSDAFLQRDCWLEFDLQFYDIATRISYFQFGSTLGSILEGYKVEELTANCESKSKNCDTDSVRVLRLTSQYHNLLPNKQSQ